MNKAFELIKEKIESKAFKMQLDAGIKHPSTHDAMLEKFAVLEIKEVIDETAREYNLMEELLEAKRNCGEDSDCSLCPFGQVQDRCYLSELQISGENNGWIPCSEKMPEDCGDVICTAHLKGDAVMSVLALWYNAETRRWMGCDDKETDNNVIVTAWQPLPAPYKKGHTDEYIKGYNQGTIGRTDEIQKAREYGYNKAIDDVLYMLDELSYNIYDANVLFDDIVKNLEQLRK